MSSSSGILRSLEKENKKREKKVLNIKTLDGNRWQRMEMEICETGVLKHHEMTSPATGYSPRSLHTQTTLTASLYKFAE